ncbi:MAG: DMT family transporter [Beijerinckiaceae bacterium]
MTGFPLPSQSKASASAWLTAAPGVFVLIWSTGWIAAGYAAQGADPLTFLSIRHGLAAVTLALVAVWLREVWPSSRRVILHAIVAGMLLSGLYLAGVWWAVRHGLPAGLSGVIAALQPLFTALLAPVLIGERVSARQWAGIATGFAGLAITFWPRLAALDPGQIEAAIWPIAINVMGMMCVTLGSFYQKRFVTHVALMPATVWQFVGAFIVTLPLAILLEPMRIAWTVPVTLTMIWSVLVLSIGGVSLFLLLIRRGAVAKAAALIYLVPAVSAGMAWVAFGETLTPVQMAGLAVTVAGVWLSQR